MAKGINLRAIFSADTAGIERGAKKATQSIKSFDKESSNLLSRFGRLLGTNTSEIGRMASAMEGFGAKAAVASAKSAASIQRVSVAFRVLGGAIGAIAAAGTIAWKALSAEADYYGTRLDGLAANAGIKAYRETLKALRHDHRDGAGIQEFVGRITKGWAAIGNAIQSVFRKGVSLNEDKATAEQASFLATVGTNIAVGELKSRTDIARLDATIAEKRREINDTQLTFLQRQAASNELAGLINQKANIQEGFLAKQLANTRAINALTKSSFEDLQREIDLEVRLFQVQKAREDEIRSIQRQQKRLAAETESWLESLKDLATSDAMEELELTLAVNDQELLDSIDALAPQIESELAALSARMQPIELKVDTLPAVKMLDLLPVLETGFKQSFANIGEAIGNALSGADGAAGDFGAAMLATLGDMAVKVGELSVATGLAISGIEASLKTLNPVLAIAAGAALIALGSAVKAGAANIARGGSGYSSLSAAGYNQSQGTSDLQARQMTIKVVGELRGDGRSLVGTIREVEKVTSHTT